MEKLESELIINDLLDVISNDVATDRDYTVNERVISEEQVRGIIISRLDNHHHRLVLGIKDPRRIIYTVKNQREI